MRLSYWACVGLLLSGCYASDRKVADTAACGQACAEVVDPGGDDSTTVIEPGDTTEIPDLGSGGDDTTGVPPADTSGGDEDVPYDCRAHGTCPEAGGAEILQVGSGAYRLRGVIVTPTGPINGEVLVVADTIACVGECSGHADAAGAWVIDTHGVILPGLIDTHNHILFDVFDNDDWVPQIPDTCAAAADCAAASPYCKSDACACVDGRCRYLNHNQWPKEDEYSLMLDYKQCLEGASQGRPDWCPTAYDGDGDVKCELQKWGELKGLVAGTTSIVGLPGTASKCVGTLARSIDVSQNGLGVDGVQTSALFPPSKTSGDGVCKNVTSGTTKAYLIHVGEGVDAASKAEFAKLSSFTTTAGCLLNSATAITHGTAFGPEEFGVMASHGMKLTWSPASNVALYGSTTDVPAARAAGVVVSLAPDWSMGGSQNLLDELRFADAWDNAHFGDVLTPRDLFDMVTVDAAKVLALEGRIGAIEVGLVADLLVIGPSASGDPYEALLAATPASVRLVMVGGAALVGDPSLRPLAPESPECDTVSFCGAAKFLCVASAATTDKLNQTYADIEGALGGAFTELDAIAPVDFSLCSACKGDEECFEFRAKPIVDGSSCPTACAAGEVCVHATKSGANQYKCEKQYTCSPRKSQKAFAPVAPLARCE